MDSIKIFINKAMEKIKEIDRNKLKKVTIGVCILLVAFSYYGIKKSNANDIGNEAIKFERGENRKNISSESNGIDDVNEKIIVQIAGAVSNPKVCKMPQDTRVYQVIQEAGGLLPEADPAGLNLAAPVNDGDKIYIPKIGEMTDPDTALNQVDEGYAPSISVGGAGYENKININRATREELQQIPGIGPQTADKIVNYRKENGIFRKVDDLKNVKGIGDKTFEKMRSMIRIN